MELAQLRMFVAVAEELHFRRAAERCHVAQPALSRRIRGLEAELGVVLFRRTKQEVELTEAGRRFLVAAREGLAAIDVGARELGRMSDALGVLRVGAAEYANFAFLPPAMRSFRDRHPGIAVVRRDLHAAQQVAALRAGELDVGFHGAPDKERDLVYEPVVRATWTVALPAGHPLAAQQTVAPADLAGQPLVLFPRAANPPLHDWIRRRLAESGAPPGVVHEPAQLHTALGLVGAGLGVFPTPFHLEGVQPAGVVLRQAAGFDLGVWVTAVHRKGDRSALLSDFLEAARRAAAGRPETALG
jgi:DNA-binding transcriptional LysR family regulator